MRKNNWQCPLCGASVLLLRMTMKTRYCQCEDTGCGCKFNIYPPNHTFHNLNPRAAFWAKVESTLGYRELEIIRLRLGFYGKAHSLSVIGVHFNVTRERVRQIEAQALSAVLPVDGRPEDVQPEGEEKCQTTT